MGKGGDSGIGEILSAKTTTTASRPDNAAAAPLPGPGRPVIPVIPVDPPRAVGTAGPAKLPPAASRPWYARGGFHVNEIGMGVNVLVPPAVLLAAAASGDAGNDGPLVLGHVHPGAVFGVLLALQMLHAFAFEGMRTTFCLIVAPVYVTTLLVVPWTLGTGAWMAVAAAVALGIWRGGVCMSVCLHRYAAHAAFKCSPTVRLFLNVLGCAAHQGGPIWWASQHRCHHKHCDVPGDPHSALLDGNEKAFCFFERHGAVKEEFVPRHNDTFALRVLDTFSFAVCLAEMVLAYRHLGRVGLFVSYTSIWLCQTGTLWFNLMNHPAGRHPERACQASNGKEAGLVGEMTNGIGKFTFPAFALLDFICPVFAAVTSESDHDDHHVRSMLARRERYDVFYLTFVWPLEKAGLVWDVKTAPPE